MKKIFPVLLALWGLTMVVSCSTSTPSTPKPFGAGTSGGAGTNTPTPGGSSGTTSTSPTPVYMNNYGTSSGPNALSVVYGANVTLWVADGSVTQGGDVTQLEIYTLAAGALSGGPFQNTVIEGVPTPGLSPAWEGTAIGLVNPRGLANTVGWYGVLDSANNAASGGSTFYECGTDAGFGYGYSGVTPTLGNSYGGLPMVAPRGLAADKQGNFYVTDAGNGDVYEFATGCFGCTPSPNPPEWEHFWTGSSTAFPFRQPYGIACDQGNNVWISDIGYTPSEIEEYGPSGGTTFITSFKTMTGCVASYIAVDTNDDVYVADTGNGQVEEYSPTGYLMRVLIVPTGTGHTYLPFKPTCIALAYNGASLTTLTNIIVGDYNNNLVDVFGP